MRRFSFDTPMKMVTKMSKLAANSKSNITQMAQKSTEKGKKIGLLAQSRSEQMKKNALAGAAASRTRLTAAKIAAVKAQEQALKKSKELSSRLRSNSVNNDGSKRPDEYQMLKKNGSDRHLDLTIIRQVSAEDDGLFTPKSIASSSRPNSLVDDEQESEQGPEDNSPS